MVMSNNSTESIFSSGVVSSVGVPFRSAPGFAIPLVRLVEGGNSYYIQRIGGNKKIVGFELFDAAVNLRHLEKPYYLEIGDSEVYSLVDPRGTPHVGTKHELAPTIRDWVAEVEYPLLQMNFARFCGRDGVATRAAREAVRIKQTELNDDAAAIQWFIDSVISAELVAMLFYRSTKPITDEEMNKTHLSVSGLSESRLSLQIETQNISGRAFDNNVTKELEKLQIFLGKVLDRRVHVDIVGTEGPIENAWNVEMSPRHDRDERRTERIVNEIRHRRRQEERLALVLDLLVANDPAGWDVLHNYVDRAKFARRAMAHIAHLLSKRRTWQGDKNLSKIISKEIWAIFRLAYPQQRGTVLLELARVLKHDTDIAKAIKWACQMSNSVYVNDFRQKILRELDSK